MLTGQMSFPDTEQGYQDAERFADQWAGDNNEYAVVVEDTENNLLHVMDHASVEGFLAEWGGCALYRADHRVRCHSCESICGQVIRVRNRDYCSFKCLEGSSDDKFARFCASLATHEPAVDAALRSAVINAMNVAGEDTGNSDLFALRCSQAAYSLNSRMEEK